MDAEKSERITSKPEFIRTASQPPDAASHNRISEIILRQFYSQSFSN